MEHIVFQNEENGYTVFTLAAEDGDLLTCVGNTGKINEGECLSVNGNMVDHPTYGVQLKVVSWESRLPEDAISIERYLGSGAIKGVGQKTARLIVEKFGEDTFRIIEEEPERLAEIRGISKKKAFDISIQMDGKREMRRAMIFLQGYGISLNLAAKIYDYYEEDIYRVIRENPYRMAEDIDGVGFRIADEIASKAGIRVDSDYRIVSGLLYCLSLATGEGHIYLPEEVLLSRAQELLSVPEEHIRKFIMDLVLDRRIVLKEKVKKDALGAAAKEHHIYLSKLYSIEYHTALMLHERNVRCKVDEEKAASHIERIEKRTGIRLDDLQRTAVLTAIRNGLMVITGGPGTGKTTTIHTLIQYFEEEGLSIALAAPTGRAARRMSEATGREAQTIHRLLEVSAGVHEGMGPTMFERNADNPLEYDVVIIDETSMVDIYLMHALLSAMAGDMRLILVGDMNQLPSVGPGSVLRDIIASHAFNVVMLTKIFRQAAESDIIVNAHRIHAGEELNLSNHSKDFFFLERADVNRIISNMIELVGKKLPKYVNAPSSEIQILTPMRKGVLGVERLNSILQRYLNPQDEKKPEKEFGGTLFRLGDKVMQIKNDYQLEWEIHGKSGVVIQKGSGIFNGDIGVITRVDSFLQEVVVLFDGEREVHYPYSLLEELELAYAITIHKAQGSEYPAVVIPILSGPPMLMNRNLLYTAVTRAKKCVTILGSSAMIRQMIENTSEVRRYTSLARWIRESAGVRRKA